MTHRLNFFANLHDVDNKVGFSTKEALTIACEMTEWITHAYSIYKIRVLYNQNGL